MEDSPSHLSLLIDLSPTQWHLCSLDSNPLPLGTFLSHLLTFLNTHVACKHENTLAVFAALPGKRLVLYASSQKAMLDNFDTSTMLYSSLEMPSEDLTEAADSNTYQPFRSVDAAVMKGIAAHVAEISDKEREGVGL